MDLLHDDISIYSAKTQCVWDFCPSNHTHCTYAYTNLHTQCCKHTNIIQWYWVPLLHYGSVWMQLTISVSGCLMCWFQGFTLFYIECTRTDVLRFCQNWSYIIQWDGYIVNFIYGSVWLKINKWSPTYFGCKFAHYAATLGLVRIMYPTYHTNTMHSIHR